MSLLRFAAASRVSIIGFGLYARCVIAGFLPSDGDAMLKSKRRGATFTERSVSGEDRDGEYGV